MCGYARLGRHGIGGESTGLQRGRNASDHVFVRHRAVQQQDFDQRAGAFCIAVNLADGSPPGVVDRGEYSRGAGLVERSGSGKAPGLRTRASR